LFQNAVSLWRSQNFFTLFFVENIVDVSLISLRAYHNNRTLEDCLKRLRFWTIACTKK
jgi:hypothetical protein